MLLDTIKQMQQQGYTDEDIAMRLREQGYSPRDIDDAVNQSRIKAAVNQEENIQQTVINSQEMQPSMMQQQEQPNQPQDYSYPQSGQQEQYAQQYSPQQTYQEYYPQQQGQQADTETMTEIAEQIFSEKFAEIKKALMNLADFKTVTDAKISGIDDRLRRIESIIAKLESSIIGKIGDYGQAIEDLRDEMISTQESFSKVINPLVDKKRKSREEAEESPEEQEREEQQEMPAKKSKKKADFEDYLR